MNNIDNLVGIIEIYTTGGLVSYMHWYRFVQRYIQLKNENQNLEGLDRMRELLLNANVLTNDKDEEKMCNALKQTLASNQINFRQKR